MNTRTGLVDGKWVVVGSRTEMLLVRRVTRMGVDEEEKKETMEMIYGNEVDCGDDES